MTLLNMPLQVVLADKALPTGPARKGELVLVDAHHVRLQLPTAEFLQNEKIINRSVYQSTCYLNIDRNYLFKFPLSKKSQSNIRSVFECCTMYIPLSRYGI